MINFHFPFHCYSEPQKLVLEKAYEPLTKYPMAHTRKTVRTRKGPNSLPIGSDLYMFTMDYTNPQERTKRRKAKKAAKNSRKRNRS